MHGCGFANIILALWLRGMIMSHTNTHQSYIHTLLKHARMNQDSLPKLYMQHVCIQYIHICMHKCMNKCTHLHIHTYIHTCGLPFPSMTCTPSAPARFVEREHYTQSVGIIHIHSVLASYIHRVLASYMHIVLAAMKHEQS